MFTWTKGWLAWDLNPIFGSVFSDRSVNRVAFVGCSFLVNWLRRVAGGKKPTKIAERILCKMCFANCSCEVLATPVNYDGHFILPATPHARALARASMCMVLYAEVLFLIRKKEERWDACHIFALVDSWTVAVGLSLFVVVSYYVCIGALDHVARLEWAQHLRNSLFFFGVNVVCIPRT
jgi:hypothetical protein